VGGVEGARSGCGVESVGCGWAGRGSIVLWGELLVVAGLCMGEERSLRVASFGSKVFLDQNPTRIFPASKHVCGPEVATALQFSKCKSRSCAQT